MPRNRRAAVRRLSVERESFLLLGNMLTRVHRTETDEAAEVRLFGSRATAAAAWEQHRDALLAEDPVPGRRPAGWWRHERRRSVPPVAQQPEILRALGELSESEEATLSAWAAMTPEPPADLSLDHQSITANLEEPHVDATSAAARPEATPIEAGFGAGAATNDEDPTAEASDDTPPEPERVEESVVRKPQILSPWPLQNGRNPNEGWL